MSPLDFFQLYFMPVLVDEIVQHTNVYACIEVAKENSNKRWKPQNGMGVGETQSLLRS